jgi:hypothetical protein
MIAWLKRMWSRRLILRSAVTPSLGDVVYLHHNPTMLTVTSVTEHGVTLSEPEQRSAVCHIQVSHGLPWDSFRAQLKRFNGRRVW